jgi:hypothetical protein
VSFALGLCCGRQDYEQRSGGIERKGMLIDAWVAVRCVHCQKGYRIMGYCKKAGDGDATDRQHRHRSNKQKKVVSPSTGIVVNIGEPSGLKS